MTEKSVIDSNTSTKLKEQGDAMIESDCIRHARAILPQLRLDHLWMRWGDEWYIDDGDLWHMLKSLDLINRRNIKPMLDFIRSYDESMGSDYSSFAHVSAARWWLGVWYYVCDAYCYALADTLMQIAPKDRLFKAGDTVRNINRLRYGRRPKSSLMPL
jgi:hypothetical protein